MEDEETTHKVLDYIQFFEKYGKTAKDSRFTYKAYSETGNSVALYPEQLEFDCYLQLPDFGKDVVPDSRRYIYLVKAGEHKNIPHKVGTFPNGKDKVSIAMEHLTLFADPYTEFKEKIFNKTKEEELIESMKKLIEDYERSK